MRYIDQYPRALSVMTLSLFLGLSGCALDPSKSADKRH